MSIKLKTQLQDVLKTALMRDDEIDTLIGSFGDALVSEKDMDVYHMSGHLCLKYNPSMTWDIIAEIRKKIGNYAAGDKMYSRIGVTIAPSENDLINKRSLVAIVSDIKKDNCIIYPGKLKESLAMVTEEDEDNIADRCADTGVLFGSRRHANRSMVIVGLTLLKRQDDTATFRLMLNMEYFAADKKFARIREITTTYDYQIEETKHGGEFCNIMKPVFAKVNTLPPYIVEELIDRTQVMSKSLLKSNPDADLDDVFKTTEVVVDPVCVNDALVTEYSVIGASSDSERKRRYGSSKPVLDGRSKKTNSTGKKTKSNEKPKKAGATKGLTPVQTDADAKDDEIEFHNKGSIETEIPVDNTTVDQSVQVEDDQVEDAV